MMQRLLAAVEALDQISEIYEFVVAKFQEFGVIRQSYHITPWGCAPNSMEVAVLTSGFSDEWLDLYEKADFRKKDPIPSRIMTHAAMMKWTDAMMLGPNTPENEEYFAAMREYGLIHGCGLPLYGPAHKDFYASFDFGRPIEEIDTMTIGIVRALAQDAHQRITVLAERELKLPKLSERESEVLHWFARGKSLPETGIILGLSTETVKTYSNRLFAKFEVHDRISLIIKASRHGFLQL